MEIATLDIGGRRVGPGQPCLVIAEVAQAHDGSLGMAHAFIDAVSRSGAGAVKFQTHIAAAESSRHEPFRVRFSSQDETRYDYWRRMEFSPPQWRELADHARDAGLIFLSSPFSEEAADLLLQVGVPAWKVASGEVTNRALLEKLIGSQLPLLISTGMSGWTEIEALAKWLRTRSVSYAMFQCTSAYPCSPRQVGLNVLQELRQRCCCPVGLSDHSGSIFPGLAAVALGASMVEVHATFSRGMFGPDVPASVTFEELRQLVEGVRFIEEMLANPVDKDSTAAEAAPLRSVFMKSLFARVDLPAGTCLQPQHLAGRKPGTGVPVEKLHELVGRRLRRDLAAGEMLTEDHLEP